LAEQRHFKGPLALVVLNVCRDPLLREERAKTLHDAGYYTSGAQTPEEAIQLATQINFAIAVVCYSLTARERTLVREWMQEKAPATTVVLLGKSSDDLPESLLSAVSAAVHSRNAWHAAAS
jgi:DNA-binding response OmpR family regulator